MHPIASKIYYDLKLNYSYKNKFFIFVQNSVHQDKLITAHIILCNDFHREEKFTKLAFAELRRIRLDSRIILLRCGNSHMTPALL